MIRYASSFTGSLLKQIDDAYAYLDMHNERAEAPDAGTALGTLAALYEAQTGKQIFVINGNHDLDMQDDVPSYSMDHVQFREIYHQFGYQNGRCVDA